MGFRNIILRVYVLVIVMLIAMTCSPKVIATNHITDIYMTVGETAKLPKEVRCKGYTYKISNSKLLQLSDKGKMLAKKRGNVNVTAIYNNGIKTVKKKYKVRIHDKIKKFKWANKIDEMFIDDQYKCVISYKVKSKKNVSFKWDSTDKKVAEVDKNGIVKGIAAGETIISCTVKGQKKAVISFELQVNEKPVQTFKSSNNNSTRKLFEVSKLHNGDAKFFGDKIITSVSGKLCLYGMDGNQIKKYDNVKCNWLASLEDERLIIYGNSDKEVGIVSLDDNYNIVTNSTILRSDNLLIDPTISKIDGKYYITVTEIKGTINNSDVSVKNGEYWIHLYESDNLNDWELISDIEHMNNNLEDVDLICIGDVIYSVYEVEELDKGNSSIVLRSSKDKGRTWSDLQVLLESDCDHEPVGLYRDNDKYIICYSCDKEYPGKSYMGGRTYYSIFDKNWNCLEKDKAIVTECDKGILWYDYMILDDKEYFLFAKDYFTTCDMIVEWR